MNAPTDRPAAPACYCDGAGPCGACRWGLASAPSAEVPTVPAPGPCQEDALFAALLKRDAAVREAFEASKHLDDAGKYRAMVRYEAERNRLRAMRTAD